HRALHPHPPRSTLPRRHGHALRLHLLGGVRRPVAGGGQDQPAQPVACRHRPLRLQPLRQGRPGALQGQPGLLPRQARDRQPDLRHHPRPQRAPAEGARRRVPAGALPETRGRGRHPQRPAPGGGRDRRAADHLRGHQHRAQA
ncbi:Oligopeptide-binding oppA-like protein, partial [Daphnia magna]